MLLGAILLQAQPRYDMQHINREKLNRGVVAIRSGEQVVVSWRTLMSDAANEPFDVYRCALLMADARAAFTVVFSTSSSRG